MASELSRRAVHPGWLLLEEAVEAQHHARETDEQARFRAFMQLIRTAGAIDRAATDVLADLDLTAGAFGALVELKDVGEIGIAPSELARRLSVARRTATLYVDILTRHGWAAREPHPEDRRMVLARLTPEGERLLAECGAIYQSRLASLLGDMNSIQAERLRQLLTLIPTEAGSNGTH